MRQGTLCLGRRGPAGDPTCGVGVSKLVQAIVQRVQEPLNSQVEGQGRDEAKETAERVPELVPVSVQHLPSIVQRIESGE